MAVHGHRISISIHAPREGCDIMLKRSDDMTQFQSTHPVRGATAGLGGYQANQLISIHAPREGCDNAQQAERTFIEFQSTHPVRGATRP
mgnify:CR=1 FL=1